MKSAGANIGIHCMHALVNKHFVIVYTIYIKLHTSMKIGLIQSMLYDIDRPYYYITRIGVIDIGLVAHPKDHILSAPPTPGA